MSTTSSSVDTTPNSRTFRSLYSEVMNDERARDAYLNTTQVILTGNPRHPETREICKALREASIAFLFTSNHRLPRPELQSRQMIFVGKTDILNAIPRLTDTLH